MPDRLLTGAIAAPLAQMMGDDGGGMGWGAAMMAMMVVATLVFVALAVVGLIWLVRSLRDRAGHERDDGGAPDALRVLERRLAEGEIEIDEYRERRSTLERER